MPITTNILQRTFQFSFHTSQGTCFTVDRNNRQYVVTSRHLVKPITDSATIRIKHENVWKQFPVNLVGHCEGEIDISVLTLGFQLSPSHPLPPTSAGLILGQDVYFMGFPYGLTSEIGELNRNFPVPIVKKATLSALATKTEPFLLDGHNNPGFSGGPVVFSPTEKPNNQPSVAGVISAYRFNMEPVYFDGNPTSLEFRYNTGIIVAYGIKYAVDLIDKNPIGFYL